MKKAFSLICTLSFALVAIADETSTVNYGTQTTTPPFRSSGTIK